VKKADNQREMQNDTTSGRVRRLLLILAKYTPAGKPDTFTGPSVSPSITLPPIELNIS